MKRITRTIPGDESGARVWLDQYGHWTRDETRAFEFPDAEANERIKRIPHAVTADAGKRGDKNE